MNTMDQLRVLSGCRFYERFVDARGVSERLPPDPPPSVTPGPDVAGEGSNLRNRLFRKYCFVLGALLLGSAALVVLPLWLAHPPYGRACLLSLPPMLLCTLSWMAGAWWSWDKDRFVLMATTLGVIPFRLLLLLSWVLLVRTIPEIPILALVLSLMWHWLVFTVAEFGMLLEFSRRGKRTPTTGQSGGRT